MSGGACRGLAFILGRGADGDVDADDDDDDGGSDDDDNEASYVAGGADGGGDDGGGDTTDVATKRRLAMVHRDIKSASILVDDYLNAKIADFGLVREVAGEHMAHEARAQTLSSRWTQTVNLKGTPDYMPPEAMDGVVSGKFDAYAMGLVIAELMTGLEVRSTTGGGAASGGGGRRRRRGRRGAPVLLKRRLRDASREGPDAMAAMLDSAVEWDDDAKAAGEGVLAAALRCLSMEDDECPEFARAFGRGGAAGANVRCDAGAGGGGEAAGRRCQRWRWRCQWRRRW